MSGKLPFDRNLDAILAGAVMPLSIYLSIYLYQVLYLSIYLSIYLYIYTYDRSNSFYSILATPIQ